MSSQTLNLDSKLYQYYQAIGYREPEVLKALRIKTQSMPGGGMQVSPEQGQFMALLMELIQAKKTLDIGTFTGYSALAVALALPKEGRVITCDIDKAATTVAQEFWQQANMQNKIQLHLAPALQTLQKLLDNNEANTFNFVFIDADKKNYKEYYEKSLLLLRAGGLIAIDNVLWGGDVADKDDHSPNTVAIRELNEFIFADKRVSLSMLPIGDGLTLARKR